MTAFPLPNSVAVMQPYFFPYAGYYRLLAVPRTFVILDCAQFPRRGRVHRTPVVTRARLPAWLTLPLSRAPRNAQIRELRFAPHASELLHERLAKLDWLMPASGPLAERIREHLYGPLDGVVDFLERGLRLVADALGLEATIVRSSALALDADLRGQARVIAIVEALGGRCYVNAPGGRSLYDAASFERRGLELRFLTRYTGKHTRMLKALVECEPSALREDILQSCLIEP